MISVTVLCIARATKYISQRIQLCLRSRWLQSSVFWIQRYSWRHYGLQQF